MLHYFLTKIISNYYLNLKRFLIYPLNFYKDKNAHVACVNKMYLHGHDLSWFKYL